MIRVIMLVFILSSCTNGGNSLDKNQSIGYGYRLFKNTPVWELAQSVAKSDTISIEGFLKSQKQFVDYTDPIFGQTLLMDAVYNRNYTSVKTLLKFGADPNKQSLKDKESSLMMAVDLGPAERHDPSPDSRILKLLLKYGGNPNDMQDGDSMPKGRRNYGTPLTFACLASIPEYVRILVDSGANRSCVSTHLVQYLKYQN